ncbi:MAG TPA: glycosyltransferase, partial [Acetobacteraceae bacterium]|nr:glycosyltransferase [Acetobacteraceae bacterium]
ILNERYPFYHALVAAFLRSDPLHDLRNNVQKAVWRQHDRIAVFVTLALDGGAARHASDLMARLTREGWLVLALTAGHDADGTQRLALTRAGSDEALRYPIAAPQEEALGDILDLAPRFIHVQHLIDLPDGIAAFVRSCGIPYAVTLHDFFYACPKVTLLDAGARYCGMPPAAKCTRCVRQGPVHPHLHPTLRPHAEAGERWRGLWEGFLRDATQVIAPSQDTANRYAQLFPGLAVSVRPHFAPADLAAAPPRPARRSAGPRLRVALPGAIGPQKGSHELVELARHCSRWHDDIDFVVVGYTDREEEFRRYDNVTVLGGYRPAEALTALAAAGCDVALLLNVFPETFSYTLSECLQVGLPPVAYDFGAVGERMRALGVGVALPPGAPPEQIVSALRMAAQHPALVPAASLYGQYGKLMADYYAPALADLAEVAPAPDAPRLLGPVAGLDEDNWCDGTLRVRLWSARKLQRLALTFWVPEEGRFQAVTIACNGVPLGRHVLEEGTSRRFVVPLPADEQGRRAEITCRFDFVFRLQPPDIRSRAAMLASIQVSEGVGWHTLDLPDALSAAPARPQVAAA